MKKVFILASFIFATFSIFSQGITSTTTIPLTIQSIKNLGTSRNAYGVLGVRQFIAASSASNSVAIIRRASSPASSGTLRMDVSTDGGSTWNIDNYTIWNNNLSNNAARYPRVTLYNPTGNTNSSNTLMVSAAPLLDGTNSNWGGLGLASMTLNGGALNSQSFSSNAALDTLHEIPYSFVTAGSKVFLLDRNAASGTNFNDKFMLATGSISGTSVNWTRRIINFVTGTGPSGKAGVADATMAFDAAGQVGYLVALSHTDFNSEPEETVLPVVLKTTDGGATWGNPVQLSLRQVVNTALGTTTPIVPTTGFEISAAVDQQGNCHFFVHIGESATTAYSINHGSVHAGMFHFSTNGTSILNCKRIGTPRTFRGSYGISGNTIEHDTRPCVSKNESASKIFFTWSETDVNLSSANNIPDLITVGFDVATNKYTSAFKIDAGFPALFGSVAPIVLERNGSNGTKDFELPMAFIELNGTGDALDSCIFKYIKGAVINSKSFNQFIHSQGNITNICSGGTATLLSGIQSGNQWYRNGTLISGANTSTYSATMGGTYYSIVGGDTSNSITISVGQGPVLSLPDTIRTTSSSVTLSPGSAQSYLWSTGDTMPTLIVYNTGMYYVSATASNGCSSSKSVYVIFSTSQPPANTPVQSTSVINYQGIAVDVNQLPIVNSNIGLRFSVLDATSSGTVLYTETHSTTTDGFGYFKAYLGGGTATVSSFSSIPWSNGNPKFLKVDMDDQGGTLYRNIGTTQLVSVPYAMHAKTVDELKIGTILRGNNGTSYQLTIGSNGPEWTSIAANCGTSISYSGETYPTVQIGTHCWFSKNLNVGTMVNGNNDQTNNASIEKYCYNNDPANCTTYGGLYQWAEAVQYQNGATNSTLLNTAFSGNVKGICPTGWHLPSQGDWTILETQLGGSNSAGGPLKSTSNLWISPNTGASNSSGFNGIPGGLRQQNGSFQNQGQDATFWSAVESNASNANRRSLGYNYSFLDPGDFGKNFGFSVRCLKD